MDVSVSGTIDRKTYLKKFRGASAPLAPPGSAYERVLRKFCHEVNLCLDTCFQRHISIAKHS